MNRVVLHLAILTTAVIAACAAPRQNTSAVEAHAAPIVPQTAAYRAGTGVVQRVVLAPGPISSVSGGTATGASGHAAGTSATRQPEPPVGVPSNAAGRLTRLAIKMDAGGDLQYVDTDSAEFKEGTRVELTPDRMIRKLP